MITQLIISLRALVVLTVLTCIVYPLAVTGLAQLCFPRQAGGSLVVVNQAPVGSELLAQNFTTARYFWPRPSAGNFATVPSGASNLGPTSQALATAIEGRRKTLGVDAPADLLTTSGSGLDPHVSPEAAHYQVARVAQARHLPVAQVTALVQNASEPPQFGVFGEPRVNILLLNRALDALK